MAGPSPLESTFNGWPAAGTWPVTEVAGPSPAGAGGAAAGGVMTVGISGVLVPPSAPREEETARKPANRPREARNRAFRMRLGGCLVSWLPQPCRVLGKI